MPKQTKITCRDLLFMHQSGINKRRKIKIKINENAAQFNCHWYCTEVNNVYKSEGLDSKTNCYVVIIKGKKHLVDKNHADIISPKI